MVGRHHHHTNTIAVGFWLLAAVLVSDDGWWLHPIACGTDRPMMVNRFPATLSRDMCVHIRSNGILCHIVWVGTLRW